ncbi:penicillin-binding protein-related factor A (putative recombinase) [Bacillus sp. JUb91]|nr:penicillin-binding protein-related factor A (putative recombinase) [Bacillus sp. JUb91]
MLFARYLTKNNAAYSNMVVGEVISYKGRAVAFEAKSTNEINRFDLI